MTDYHGRILRIIASLERFGLNVSQMARIKKVAAGMIKANAIASQESTERALRELEDGEAADAALKDIAEHGVADWDELKEKLGL